jgi:GWxTD domain-containing protein
LQAQVFAQFGSCSFNTPTNAPFVETYLYINGPALFAHEGGGGFHNSVNVAVKITKDSTIVKANKYNLKGPQFQRNTEAPGFIDQQRYSLPPGDYHIEINITDNYTIRKRTLTIHDSIHLAYPKNSISLSEIQPVDSYSKASEPGPLTKSGLDLIPLVGAFYPQSTKQLNFYVEAYQAEKTLGKAQSFVFVYYVETAAEQLKMNSFGSFKKQTTAVVNPLLGKIDISTLGSGNYHLVVELRDAKNQLIAAKRLPFQRLNQMMEITALQDLSEREKEAQYFGRISNADTLKMLVECLWPIANTMDKERIINQSVKKDPDLMKKFVIQFWEQRAADTANPVKLWGAYYQEVQKVLALFKCGKQQGYYTDRGRVFLQYGAPSVRSIQQAEDNTYPYEIWQYYRTTDQTNGQFFSNRKFVFVNKTLGDDCFKLIHSDMRGETNNPRWQFEITRRNNNGMANPDNNTPVGTEYNRMNEIFNNPR